ncbi:4-(cytidine 5'-diphospho)-2-C-methyl-D-erythritol kinase, partial [archaeon]|nr:4-(cytidine 5'-diphospho)-2-C-methyl-D-erythritol kinase [archaeon]
LYDDIVIEKQGSGISLNAEGSGCEEQQNLGYRAAELFLKETGIREGVSIEITKRIPVGAGLGGGSSDAASVLMGMNDLFRAGLTDRELMGLAARIGSDCPFFILKGPYLMGGRGEIPLKPVIIEPRSYLIVVPPFGVSTSLVYSNFKCPLTIDDKSFTINEISVENGYAPERLLVNELEDPAFGICPEVRQIKTEILDTGALGVIMSGSGSSVFGVFKDEEHLCIGMSRIRRHEGYVYIPTTSLTGGSYGDYGSKGVSGQG